MVRTRILLTVVAAAILVCGALASTASATPAAAPAGVRLQPVKSYLLKHTALLLGFTKEFRTAADRYYATAKAAHFDYARLARAKRGAVARQLGGARALWIEGNPYYERVEGSSRARRPSPCTT